MAQQLEELSPSISAVDDTVAAVNDALKPIFDSNSAELASKLSPLQRAKLDLISLYAANSLFWVYLKTQGINPTTNGLAGELSRVKTYMSKLKEVEDRKLAPRINQDASKRVMRNALWSAAHKPKTSTDGNAITPSTVDGTVRPAKRPKSNPPGVSSKPKSQQKKKKKKKA